MRTRGLADTSTRDAGAAPARDNDLFDTPDQLLAKSGVSLRVRHANGQNIHTLKASRRAGVAADRAEWEWTIKSDEPDPGLLTQTPVSEKLPHRPELYPVIVTDIARTIQVLQLDGGVVVEAALDQGTIIAGEARQPVHELELELRAGDPGALFRFALELHAAVPLETETQTKAERSYRLRDAGDSLGMQIRTGGVGARDNRCGMVRPNTVR